MSDTTLSWPYKGFQIVDSTELDYLFLTEAGRMRLGCFWGRGDESGRSDKLLRVFIPPEAGYRLVRLQRVPR